MSGPLLDEKVLALDAALSRADIPHAFGGALALAYYATPRGTVDIDLNVFVSPDEADRVLRVLHELGVAAPTARERAALAERGQVRLAWEHTPLDLFFSYDALHESCLERCRRVPFGDDAEIPVLAAEDLVLFKVLFDRDKDWRDIGEVLFSLAADFDADYARTWLGRILAADDERVRRFEQELAQEI